MDQIDILIRGVTISQQRGKFNFEEASEISAILKNIKDENINVEEKIKSINNLIKYINISQSRGSFNLDESFILAKTIRDLCKPEKSKTNKKSKTKEKLETIPEEVI